MSLEILPIEGMQKGLNKYFKPYLIEDDAFQILDNVIVYRGHIDKRPGLRLIGRLRRFFEAKAVAGPDPSEWSFNIWTLYGIAVPETTATIQPGSVILVIDTTIFTDQGNGFLTTNVAGNVGIINYLTGDIKVTYNIAPGAVTLSFAYYPNLPVMTITQRETSGINQEQSVFFDTKYAYLYSGTDFLEFIPGTTWASQDFNFYWTVNYTGLNSSDRILFVTNFVNDAADPIRYTDGASWTDFKPVLDGKTNTNIKLGVASKGTSSFSSNLTPVVQPLSVSISVGATTVTDDGSGNLAGGGYTGTINYETGDFTIVFNVPLPANADVTATWVTETTYLLSCLMLIPYYGRLLAFNTWEGADYPGTNYFNRCRFSQIGNPLESDAWRSDVFGKGGFVDAPVNQQILSCQFFKNVLIVHFERSTWRLQYIGEYGIPFIWERISTDFGSESTFSTVLFDDGILTVGDKAIIASSGNDCKRIDLAIPDTVYDIRNTDNGPQRVQGIRDFQKELVYWTYPKVYTQEFPADQYFPNRNIVFNYRTQQFSFLRNSITCFGFFQYPSNIIWGRTDIFWDDQTVFWGDFAQDSLPAIACGNQVGFVHYLGAPQVAPNNQGLVKAREQESLAITAVNTTDGVFLTIPNHNLEFEEFIYVTNLIFIESTYPYASGTCTLNDRIYQVADVLSKDVIQLELYDPILKDSSTNFPFTITGDYFGGGVVALFPNINIISKDYSPAKLNAQPPQNMQTSYLDLLIDTSNYAEIGINFLINANLGMSGNVITGNRNLAYTNNEFGYIQNILLGSETVIISSNHTVVTGETITFADILGTVQLNGQSGIATYINSFAFKVNIDSSVGYDPYVSSGVWYQWDENFYTLRNAYTWYRFYANVYGQFISLQLTYNVEQMTNISTHNSNFSLNSLKLYYRPAGFNIFGK